MKKGNTAVWVVVLIVVVLLGIYFAMGRGSSQPAPATPASQSQGGPVASANVLMVDPQTAGQSVTVKSVSLAADGFVVVHKAAADGTPGSVIGTTALKAGDAQNVSVSLSEAVTSGEKLFVMLHPDTKGNGVYDASAEGTPVNGADGNPVSVPVSVQ